VLKRCPCPPPPIGSGTGVSPMRLPILSNLVQVMLVSESRCSSSGAQHVLAVSSSPISAFPKPRDCHSNKSMNCTTTTSNLGTPPNGCLKATIGSRSAERAASHTENYLFPGRRVNRWIRIPITLVRRRIIMKIVFKERYPVL